MFNNFSLFLFIAVLFQKRVEVFIDLLNSGKISAVTVDCARTNDLLKLLDTVVIKLEGGSDEDLTLLEKEYEGKNRCFQFPVSLIL